MSRQELFCGRCGNTPEFMGFQPCDGAGEPQEPVPGWGGLYRCESCGLAGSPEGIAAGRDERVPAR